MITNNCVFSVPIFFLLFCGSFFPSASATPPAKILSGITSNIASALFKWIWSIKPAAKIGMAVSSRSMVKYEGGYSVETVFDGSKLGIEPYSVEVTPSGELLVLDSENSNVYKISTPLSRYSRPNLLAGSHEGLFGHVDGKPRESRMNHPKGLTADDRGNVYVADTMNMAIRKISDTGVVTIAGGNWARGTGHIDGPSDNAKFSDDFDIIYVASSCSILVIDRGNQAIREIQLHEDDCSYQYDGDHNLGIAVLGLAVFFGFMLALLQRRVSAIFSSQSDPKPAMNNLSPPPYQRPVKSVRPPLIPPEDEQLFLKSLVVHQFQKHQHRQQHHQRHYSSGPQTYYEEKSETTSEVVFGAVQEQDGKHGAVVIKAVDYSNHPNYGNQNVRSSKNMYESDHRHVITYNRIEV
ncbi:hypothetical protein L1987_43857 [Smallanthus sonchifolius]|uniref:Uncharacterized protein n=1 Tax=Smallanthus sonchifolius TaxID=185202 RepID=A0ACB9GPV1_9ASTR|nr:hypothetical protein L1987_43857 [Smallanthus sonchifolius]